MAEPDRLEVVPGAVRSLGGDLQQAASTFNASAKNFDSAMQALISATKGSGSQAIGNLSDEWVRAHGQVTGILNKLGINTEDAGVQYEAGRQNQDEDVRSKGNRMDFKVEGI
ncbi:MAG: hypothetical protein WAV90_13970 [Gordonia amarae]